MYRLVIVYVVVAIFPALAMKTCVPNARWVPSSKLEKACWLLPYRTHFTGGRCFFAVSRADESFSPCDQVQLNADIANPPVLAFIDTPALELSLKQSNSFDRTKRYVVESNMVNGQNHIFGASGHATKRFHYLCEIRDKRSCPMDTEMVKSECVQVVKNMATFEKAYTDAAENSGTLTFVERDEMTRLIATIARNKGVGDRKLGSPMWVNMQFGGACWKHSDDDNVNESCLRVSYYEWMTTAQGMYTQFTSNDEYNYGFIFTGIMPNGTAPFGHWGTAKETTKLPYVYSVPAESTDERIEEIVPISPGQPPKQFAEPTTTTTTTTTTIPTASATTKKIDDSARRFCDKLADPAENFGEVLRKAQARLDDLRNQLSGDNAKCSAMNKQMDNMAEKCDTMYNKMAPPKEYTFVC